MYVQLLEAFGFDAVGATTCAEALAKARTGTFAAIVLDRRLPDGDGNDVCRALKADARTRALPVVVMSGKPQDEDVAEDVYLMKPVLPDVLVQTLRRLLPG